MTTPEYKMTQAEYEALWDSRADTDPPAYPAEWTAEQRTAAYWHVHARKCDKSDWHYIPPQCADDWYAVEREINLRASRQRGRIREILNGHHK